MYKIIFVIAIAVMTGTVAIPTITNVNAAPKGNNNSSTNSTAKFFGIPIKSEISISDIISNVTSIALISSALVFYFGYSQTSKSEQIKIAREATDRIETKRHELWIVDDSTKDVTGQDIRFEIFREWLWKIGNTLYELQYFTHLVIKGEIKDILYGRSYSSILKKRNRKNSIFDRVLNLAWGLDWIY